MRKIPTLFERIYENHKVVGITDKVTPGMEWVLQGEGVATLKIDGSCCAIIDGVFYKRYDAKKGKKPPCNAIPCCDPDIVTGHHPHWVPVDYENPADKWFYNAYFNTTWRADGTYEAVGPHFQGNPYKLKDDILIPHGAKTLKVERTFEGIKEYLTQHNIEGIVFWKDGEPKCKIKRSDFGFSWPVEGATLCGHCRYRHSWDCDDGLPYPPRGCDDFVLDFETLAKKQQKAIRRILAQEDDDE